MLLTLTNAVPDDLKEAPCRFWLAPATVSCSTAQRRDGACLTTSQVAGPPCGSASSRLRSPSSLLGRLTRMCDVNAF
eukprot:6214276-Pleurochrysis_carterae.AAC.5